MLRFPECSSLLARPGVFVRGWGREATSKEEPLVSPPELPGLRSVARRQIEESPTTATRDLLDSGASLAVMSESDLKDPARCCAQGKIQGQSIEKTRGSKQQERI
ncbi:hypothetical protein BDW68DRAFT_120109 [Aspergillus falconensis]